MKRILFPSLIVLTLLTGFLIGNAVSNKANAQRITIQNGQIFLQPESKVEQLLSLMQQMYVDPLDMDSITEDVMQDLIRKLDPHSAYIPKEDLEMVNSQLAGSFSGIGVQFSIQNDTVSIVAVISGGPSQSAGLLAGDKIIEVDDSVFVGKGINNEKVMHTLRGEKGTQVKLGIRRAGTPETLRYTITRGDIPVLSVDAQFIIGGNIGFIRVNKFAETTYTEFINALTSLRNQGAKAYIIDLRENSGGYMDQAIKMANEFLRAGDLIVYSEGRAYPRFDAKANGLGRFKDVPLAVLIDNFSASASEIFAGAMQDHDRALIIGRRSFGKGLVQQQRELSDGSAVRLTVARYYTPSGRCIQKPYTLGDQDDYERDILDRFEHGELYSADSIHFTDTTRYYTDAGRLVRGGGGIMPDIFVGRDTTLNTPYYNRVVNLAYTYQFAYSYTDRHRKELERFKDWQSLEKHLLRTDWVPEFVQFCADKDVAPRPAQLAKSRPLLVRLVNAYIVRNILGDEGFFPLFERDDDITKRAVQELQKP
ncbi:MAG: PDZ domain-containing protein [Paludibacteraceae bacterium]|nr:PDZ domain-containing protein [Paludibacteraceae bacterium]